MAVEVEDDVFFADLCNQISLLIMDDEEELPVQYQHLIIGQGGPQELPYLQQMMMPQTYGREGSSKGTGVFIPRSWAAPKRKNKSRRSGSTQEADGSRPSHTQMDRNSAAVDVSQVSRSQEPLQPLPTL